MTKYSTTNSNTSAWDNDETMIIFVSATLSNVNILCVSSGEMGTVLNVVKMLGGSGRGNKADDRGNDSDAIRSLIF